MKPIHTKPEEAIACMIAAYKSTELERVIQERDFEADAEIYFQSLGLPLTETQKTNSKKAFESNFRKELEDGFPDYRNVDFSLSEVLYPEPNLAIVSLSCLTEEKEAFVLRIPVLNSSSGWRVVLHPNYDQF